MKHLLVCSLMICLLFSSTTGVLGAIHNLNGDLLSWEYYMLALTPSQILTVTTDTWFTITSDPVNFKASLYSQDSVKLYDFSYYQNDFSFVELYYQDLASATILRGSYLSDPGWFIGMEYIDDLNGNTIFLSPGYRFNLQDRGYLALSLEYFSSDTTDGISAYDLDLIYSNDKLKFFAQYYSPTDEYDGLLPTLDLKDVSELGLNIKITDELTWGLQYFDTEYIWEGVPVFVDIRHYATGLTWDPDFMILDLRLSKIIEGDYDANLFDIYELSSMFRLGEKFALGCEYFNPDHGHPRFKAKFKYLSEESTFNLIYQFENEQNYNLLLLNYQLNY